MNEQRDTSSPSGSRGLPVEFIHLVRNLAIALIVLFALGMIVGAVVVAQ